MSGLGLQSYVAEIIDFGPLGLSFGFATIATLLRPRNRRNVFIPLLLEVLVFTMAAVVVVSALFPNLYEMLVTRGSYFQVLSMIVVIYAIRDIYSTLHSGPIDPKSPQS